MRANPEKNIRFMEDLEADAVTAFHLRNKEYKKSLKVVWNKTELENTTHPGVTIDRSLSYKQHIRNTKILAMSYSTAKYVAPVWARSAHANNHHPELNQACRSVTGCHQR